MQQPLNGYTTKTGIQAINSIYIHDVRSQGIVNDPLTIINPKNITSRAMRLHKAIVAPDRG